MSSNLHGLDRQLAWREFSKRRGAAPGPNQSRTAAETNSGFNVSGLQFARRGGQFVLVDNVTVNVIFNGGRSWVMDWALSTAAPFPVDLLNHEQGHYTISALIARDYFADVMLLKDQTFAAASAGLAAERNIRKNTMDKLNAVQQLYDDEVHPEQDNGMSRGPKQKAWDAFFETATLKYRPFLTPQSEWEDSRNHGYAEPKREGFGEKAEPMRITFKRVGADYLPVCERLIDILSAAGKSI